MTTPDGTPAECTCPDGDCWGGLHKVLTDVTHSIVAAMQPPASPTVLDLDADLLLLAAELVEHEPVDLHAYTRRSLIGLYDLATQMSHRPEERIPALVPVASALLIAHRSLVSGERPDWIAATLQPAAAALAEAGER
ncbi:hypothetical protein [Streptacidiphilus cavernicola]|uniref:Uncharacterized protein n=1 Tax=Streptacidiphilus cavernicola TaxID=3342716 RepID=A0ABV6VY33_9ACTN